MAAAAAVWKVYPLVPLPLTPRRVVTVKAPAKARVYLDDQLAGTEQIETTYLTGGFSWQTDYVLQLDPKGKEAELQAWVTVRYRELVARTARREGLSPAQMFLIGMIEDARVEYRAAKAFPGLKKLWGRLLSGDHEGVTEHPTVPLLERFAHCLNHNKLHINDAGLDPAREVGHGRGALGTGGHEEVREAVFHQPHRGADVLAPFLGQLHAVPTGDVDPGKRGVEIAHLF